MASTSSAVATQTFPLYRLPEDVVSDGYGEFIVFRASEGDSQVEKPLFRKLFPLLKDPCLGGSDARSSLIEKQVQAIDPSLKIAFVPRALYELLFTEAVIKHELEIRYMCSDSQKYKATKGFVPDFGSALFEGFWSDAFKSCLDSCWHVSGVMDDAWIMGASDEKKETQAELLKVLVYRMNQLCVERLHPKGHFTMGQIREHTNEAVEYFAGHAGIISHYIEYGRFNRDKGAALNFGVKESFYGRVQAEPTAITVWNRWIVDRALDIECSKSAEDAVVLYRAGNLEKEKEISAEELISTSLSFGTSLFAGAFEDGTACVFHYGAYKRREIYALIIPKAELDSSPFYCHSFDPIDQLTSMGELFHARLKIGAESDGTNVKGIFHSSATQKAPPFLISERPSTEVCSLFHSYLEKAVNLKF